MNNIKYSNENPTVIEDDDFYVIVDKYTDDFYIPKTNNTKEENEEYELLNAIYNQ